MIAFLPTAAAFRWEGVPSASLHEQTGLLPFPIPGAVAASSSVLNAHTTFNLFILQLMDIWVVSTFWLL